MPNSEIGRRKARHLEVCLDADISVEGGATGFDKVRFRHHALPELSLDEVRTETNFLGRQISFPLFVSCMTGGVKEGGRANEILARAAQRLGIPVGMGSYRILFREPDFLDQFRLRRWAPDVPVIANIGGQQLRDIPFDDQIEMLKRVEASALAVHLNPGQELFQEHGDRDFRGILDAIRRFVERSPVPVIVKETGFGFADDEITKLVDAGVAYVDVAGSGGTNWITVEAARRDGREARAARVFANWGNGTAAMLCRCRGKGYPLLASGGLRDGMDLAKSIALGAHAGGMALPLVKRAESGVDSVVEYLEDCLFVLKSVMVLVGARSVAELGQTHLVIDPALDAG